MSEIRKIIATGRAWPVSRSVGEPCAWVTTLKLVCEQKFCDLMPCDKPTTRWEASGVLVKDGHYYVVFDDRGEIARLSSDLQAIGANGLFDAMGGPL